jgi:hypothetical protein
MSGEPFCSYYVCDKCYEHVIKHEYDDDDDDTDYKIVSGKNCLEIQVPCKFSSLKEKVTTCQSQDGI